MDLTHLLYCQGTRHSGCITRGSHECVCISSFLVCGVVMLVCMLANLCLACACMQCLDREAATRGTMTLYPRAMDDGGNGHDADPATVTLLINDINDNHPYIQSPVSGHKCHPGKASGNMSPRGGLVGVYCICIQ